MPPERFAILIQGYLDGTLASAGRDELAGMLAQDPARLDELLDQLRVAAACSPGGDQLRERLAVLLAAPAPLDQRRLAGSRRFLRRHPFASYRPWLAAAAAVLVLAAGTAGWWTLDRSAALPVLHAQEGDIVRRDQQRLQPPVGTPFGLVAGDRLEIQGRGARLVWRDGSTITWEAGARAAIPASSAALVVETGDAACEVRHRPDRVFRIEVPGGTVTDCGTSFTLQVRPQGTAVVVTSGAVALQAGRQAPLTLAAGSDGHLGQGAASAAPHAVASLGFADGGPFSAATRGRWQIWGIRAQVVHPDGIPTLTMEQHGLFEQGSWLMQTFYERPLDWSRHRGVRFLLRGTGAVRLQLEDNQQPGGLPQQNELFASPWQEAAAAWRLVACPFAGMTRSQDNPRFLQGRTLPDDGLGLAPVRGIGFRLHDGQTRVEIRQLALY